MKHKQPSQIIYSTKEISENLHLFHKLKQDSIISNSIKTQSNVPVENNTQSYCSLYKTNSQKTMNDHQETMNNFRSEISKLQVENQEIREKYIKSKTKILKIEREYFPFECFPKPESDYQVVFSFKFIDFNYLFIKRTDRQFHTFYYWIRETDARSYNIDYSDLGLPGIYFDTYDNFIDYYKIKEELAIAKHRLLEQERTITKLERKSYRNDLTNTNTSSNGYGNTFYSNRNLKICSQSSMLINNNKIQSNQSNEKQENKLIIDYPSSSIEILTNGANIGQLVQSWKEYEEEKPNSSELCDRMELKQNEPEDMNIEQVPGEMPTSTRGRFFNRNEFYEKLTQVILTYKKQLILKERELTEEYTSILNDKEYMIQSLKKDNAQYIIENNNMKHLIIDLKDLITINEAELSKLLECESQIATLRLAISSLQQSNYSYIQSINQKDSQIDLKENKINSMIIQLKEKDNQIADYYNIIKKLSLNMELGERIDLKEQSDPEDNIDEMGKIKKSE